MSTLAVPVLPGVEVASVTQQEWLQASADPQLTWNLLSQESLHEKLP